MRGLEASVTEEILARGIAKLYKQSDATQAVTNIASSNLGAKVASTTVTTNLGARDGSIYRVYVAKDKKTGESLRYGFVEFFTVEVRVLNLMNVVTVFANNILGCYFRTQQVQLVGTVHDRIKTGRS